MSAFQFEEDRTVTTLPARLPGSRAVRPRHAATLILVRRDAAKPRILLGRRHGGHSFMPDKWVFPGGRVDRADFHAPYATDLRPEVAEKLHMTAPLARARALGAAIRLGCDLSSRNANILKHSSLSLQGGTLTLHVDPSHADLLLGEQTERRAVSLATRLGRQLIFNTRGN